MTLTRDIPPDLERRLKMAAQRRGVAADQCAVQLLEETLPDAPEAPKPPLEADPLMAMAGADDYDPTAIDEVVYR